MIICLRTPEMHTREARRKPLPCRRRRRCSRWRYELRDEAPLYAAKRRSRSERSACYTLKLYGRPARRRARRMSQSAGSGLRHALTKSAAPATIGADDVDLVRAVQPPSTRRYAPYAAGFYARVLHDAAIAAVARGAQQRQRTKAFMFDARIRCGVFDYREMWRPQAPHRVTLCHHAICLRNDCA